MRSVLLALAAALNLGAAVLTLPGNCVQTNPTLLRRLTNSITPAGLEGDLSFLASDLLEGRYTPSPGLNIAAEFIASRFRAAGLQPGGDDGQFFQTSEIEGGKVHNVIAILRGSDPNLRDTYLLLSAHYDHIGTAKTAGIESLDHPKPDDPDQIYNGANDDGSGTVSVIAVAQALARLRARPKRSIIFILFFGEELGLRGSRYYAEHPTVPLAQIVGALNLEQIGRTDSTEGPEISAASLTGIGYSDLPAAIQCAGAKTGVSIYLDSGNDDYFVRSDNASFAKLGIPAHTLCVAFDFPDYHRVGDEWRKIDYKNMAGIDRMVALAILNLANNTARPKWNAANAKSAPFREAAKKLSVH